MTDSQQRPDVVHGAYAQVIRELLAGDVSASADEVSTRISVGDAPLDQAGHTAIIRCCTKAGTEAVHICLRDDSSIGAEIFTEFDGRMVFVADLKFVGFDDGRFGLAIRNGSGAFLLHKSQFVMTPCRLDMEVAEVRGNEAFANSAKLALHEMGRGDALDSYILNILEDTPSGSEGARRIAQHRCGGERSLECLDLHLDLAGLLIRKNSDWSIPGDETMLSGGKRLSNEIAERIVGNITARGAQVWFHFGEAETLGPTGATIYYPRTGEVLTADRCGLWMADEDDALIFTYVSPSGRKYHFAHEDAVLRRRDGHPASDLAPGRRIAENFLRQAVLAELEARHPAVDRSAD